MIHCLKHHGARRAEPATVAATKAKKPLTARERSEQLKAYTAETREIRQSIHKLQSNPHLSPQVRLQLLQAEARGLARVQQKAAAIMKPQSAAQKSVIQNRQALKANLKASKTAPSGVLPHVKVPTGPQRDTAAAGFMGQGRALRNTQAQQEQQRLTQAWAADAKAMSQPKVSAKSRNPYINDALEAPGSSGIAATFISDIFPVRSFPSR